MQLLAETDCVGDAVPVLDRNGVERTAHLYRFSDSLRKRLAKKDESPPLHWVEFHRYPGKRIVEVPPREPAGTKELERVRAIRRRKGLPRSIPSSS
jgi:hypothetical protein